MANHIKLTSKDGNVIIIDKSRIVLCETEFLIDEEKYKAAVENNNDKRKIWRDRHTEAFFSDSKNIGKWEVDNPSPPPFPNKSDFSTDEKVTKIKLNDKSILFVKETTEDIYEKIKGVLSD